MKLLLVGWDAADWKIIDPLLARGEVPNLAGVIGAGVRGNIATIYPSLSPMLWTSIATGKRPPKHGILGFTEPAPDGSSVQHISCLGRTTKALWNILNQNGKRSIVAGWWPSHPAEPIRGAMVSNHFPPDTADHPGAPMLPGTVWPAPWAARLQDLRVHATDISGEILRMFAPHYDRIDQRKDPSVHDLAGIIAETMSIHGAATDLMEHEPWDFAAVYYVGIDHFSHRFMRYHAGKSVRSRDADLLSDVVKNAYRYHDAMLGRLLQLAGPECAVLVMSDHGFHSDRLLPDYIPAEAAGAAVEHRHFGIFCLRAPGVLCGAQVFGASVLDIAPTVLHLFGLPAAQDMDGKVLINAFTSQTMPAPIPSWDDVPGDDGRHPAGSQYDAAATAESLKQLVALGYVAPPGEDERRNVEDCLIERRYNLARAWMDAGRPDEAAGLFRGLLEQDPEQGRFYPHLFQCLLQQRQLAEAGQLLEEFDAACARFAPRSAEELQRRRTERPDTDLDSQPKDRRESYERQALAEKASGFASRRLMLRCRLALAKARRSRQSAEARALLEQVAATAPDTHSTSAFLAQGFAAIGDSGRALDLVRRSRSNDPDDWESMAIEATILAQAGRHQEAVNCAVESLSLVYFQPHLHYLLGRSLKHLGDSRAADELRIALSQMPGLVPAHLELARILRRTPGGIGEAGLHLAKAEVLRKQAKQARAKKPPGRPIEDLPAFENRTAAPPADRSRVVTVVSGLPRSGTSMMMQMLAAAGVEPFTDGTRTADEDNPRGYYEHILATGLHQDQSWIPKARGKAVKVVAHLLPHLPAGEEYRIVFLHRNLHEVAASQRAMLTRMGKTGGNLSEEELIRTYTRQVVLVENWLRNHAEIQVLAVRYPDALGDPAGTAKRLAEFVGAPFDTAAAALAVATQLRRQGDLS